MDCGRISCKSWCCVVLVQAISFAAASAAATEAGPCGSEAWADTKCCSGSAEKGAVSEETLSVVECDSTSVEGTSLVELEWHHSTLREENHDLKRIFLFSHCINPTNTSSAPSMSRLLYSSARTHLRSSTTLSLPVTSACSYFGCYEANFGNNLYTFSQVSCTTAAVSSSGLPGMPSASTVLYAVETTELELLASPTAGPPLTPSPSSRLAATSPEPALTSPQSTEVASPSTVDTAGRESSSVVQTPVATIPTSSPQADTGTPTVPLFLWLPPLLLVTITVAVITFCLLLFYASRCRSRDLWRDVKNMSWPADPWTGNPAVESGFLTDLRDLDKLSLHSVHTQYEPIVVDDKPIEDVDDLGANVPLEEPSSLLKTKVGQEVGGMRTTSSERVSDSSLTSSGVSTCPSDTDFTTSCSTSGTPSHSDSSYVTYGSLCTIFPEQTRSQTDTSEGQVLS